jgi:hypothetical protein
VLISAGFTALAWLLVPLVRIDRIEAKARSEADGGPNDPRQPEPSALPAHPDSPPESSTRNA